MGGVVVRNVKPLTDRTFQRFRELIYRETGIHMRENKQILVSNRLRKRVLALGFQSYDEYYRFLTGTTAGAGELPHFINAISTNETYFYRGDNHFEILKNDILPVLFKKRDRIRVWSAGCSTGEEPYTICIILFETAGIFWNGEIEILATDINTEVVEQARRGLYSGRSLQYLPPEHLKRYFSRQDGHGYRIRDEIRTKVRFGVHNLLKDEIPGTDFDLIFCRNVMIYFDKKTQKWLVDNSFARALSPEGYLFIGHSESLIGASEKFRYARMKAPIYVRKD
jgi:chemotaxis protein methyltransferase CheR